MRSVWFYLLDASVDEVEDVLRTAGCEHLDDERWNYPAGPNACLYIGCHSYERYPADVEDYELDLIGGATPKTVVVADVSGRVSGDFEVRALARMLLARLRGFAFDDFTADTHAWTLAEIDADERHGGLVFFDYMGFHEQAKTKPQ